MKEKIIEILGILDPPELQEIKAERLIILFQLAMIEMIRENTLCSPYCSGFERFEEQLKELK